MAEPEIGVIYNGKVVKTADFGAFVNFLGSKDGLVHISELTQGRVGKTTDVVNQGDAVKVKVIGFDDRGKVKLSMRVVDQVTGADITEQVGAKPARGGERPDGVAIVRNGATGRSAASGGSGMSAPPPVTATSLRPLPTDISRWLRGPVSRVSFGRRRLPSWRSYRRTRASTGMKHLHSSAGALSVRR